MPLHSTAFKEEVRDLRRKGHTYSEIQAILDESITKSSLSYICRDVILPETYHKKIQDLNKKHLVVARKKAITVNAQKYMAITRGIRLAAKTAFSIPLTEHEAKIALAMLYLGEGSKRPAYRGLALGSSDPVIIRLYISLLKRCYSIPIAQLRARVLYRADQDINELTIYWSQITGIPKESFYKTKPDPRTVGKQTKNLAYKGVCNISGGGTIMQMELQAIADILSNRLWGYSSAD